VCLKRSPLSLVSTIEELLGIESCCSGLEYREYGFGNPWRWQRDTLYPPKLALTSPTSGGRSVGIARSRALLRSFFLDNLNFILAPPDSTCTAAVVRTLRRRKKEKLQENKWKRGIGWNRIKGVTDEEHTSLEYVYSIVYSSFPSRQEQFPLWPVMSSLLNKWFHFVYLKNAVAWRLRPEGRGFETWWGEIFYLPNAFGRTKPWGSLCP
jgi:hypothetical protein